MKHLKKLNESITEDHEIIKISRFDMSKMTEVGVSVKEFQRLKRYFNQYPKLTTKYHYDLIDGQEIYYVTIKKSPYHKSSVYMTIRKFDDDWWVVDKIKEPHEPTTWSFWKCDQWYGLIKFLEQACSRQTRKNLDQIEMEEQGKAEKARIEDLRKKVKSKVQTMSVEELENWSKKILG